MTRKISFKVILAVGGISLAVFGLLSFFVLGAQQRAQIAQVGEHARQLTDTIKSSTRHAMLLNRRDDVEQIVDAIGRQSGILGVQIFNKEGTIIYAADEATVGTTVDKRSPTCHGCHDQGSPAARLVGGQGLRQFRGADGRPVLGVINPIYNEPGCSTADCHAHPPGQSVLGVLDVTMSLTDVERQLAANRDRSLLLTAVAIAATGVTVWLLFQVLVGKPVSRLVEATQRVAAGDLSHRLEIKRNDELGELARSFNDMTRQLSETQTQLYQSNKLASVGRLAAGIAHEINNPLTGVLTYSSLLLKGAAEGTEAEKDLAIIVRETKRCRDIVKGLLDFSRQVPPHKSRVQLNDIVRRALDIVDHQLSVHNIAVTTGLAEPLPEVRVDPNQIVQVLINLLVNAADAVAARNDGEIFVGTSLEDDGGRRSVRIKVADNGVGIPPGDLEKIFEPFFTTKESKGTGLGLAVVWGIVQEHGGTIAVHSEPERGSTFTVTLPLDAPEGNRDEVDRG